MLAVKEWTSITCLLMSGETDLVTVDADKVEVL